jgi:tRNA uridine 5-carboxymethylaminomethyl modification enzyme
LADTEANRDFLKERGSSLLQSSASLADLMRRSEITYNSLAPIDLERKPLSRHVVNTVEVQIKYDGYIAKQLQQIAQFHKLENKRLPEDLDYNNLAGIRIEAVQKLSKIKPVSVGQASRISGVSPADINVLLIHLHRLKEGIKQ